MSKGIPNNQVKPVNTIIQSEHCDDADAKRAKLVDENGDPINSSNPLPINIETVTIPDLDVNLAHNGESPQPNDGDTVAIGNNATGAGSRLLEINTDREALVHDQDTHDKLDTANASLDDIETAVESIDSKMVDGNDIGDVTVNNTDTNPVIQRPVNVHDEQTFSATGVAISTLDVRHKEFLTVEITDTNPPNRTEVQARLEGGTYETIWTIVGDIPPKAINIAKWDEVQIDVTTLDIPGATGTIRTTAHDANFKEDHENLVLEFTENGITYTASSKEDNVSPDHPVWRIKREITSTAVTLTQFADCGYFTQVLANRNSIFPPAPMLNLKSLLMGGVDEWLSVPFNAATDFDANSQPFTISCWHKRTSPSATSETVFANFAFAQAPAIPGIGLFGSNAVLSLLLINDNGATNSITKTYPGITDTNWHHYVLTGDGTGTAAGVNLYIDGVFQTPSFETDNLTASTANGNPWNFGVLASDFPFFPVLGNYDEPSLWAFEWSAAQVSEAYNEGKPPNLLFHSAYLANNANMPFYARCGDDPGDVFPTIVNLGNTGAAQDATMTNMEAGDIVDDVP